MKKELKHLALLMLFGLVQTESWRLVRWISYDYSVSMVHPFWFTEEPIRVHWYFKFLSEDLLMMILFFVIARLAKFISYRFYLFGMIATTYKFIDLLMFFANFKRWENGYTIMIGLAFIATGLILYPKKESLAPIKSMH